MYHDLHDLELLILLWIIQKECTHPGYGSAGIVRSQHQQHHFHYKGAGLYSQQHAKPLPDILIVLISHSILTTELKEYYCIQYDQYKRFTVWQVLSSHELALQLKSSEFMFCAI